MEIFLEQEPVGGRQRLRAFWRILAFLVLFVVITSVLGSLLVAVWAVAGGPLVGLGSGVEQGLDNSSLLLLNGVASLFAVFIALWVAGRLLDRRPLRSFGFRLGGGWFLDLGFGLALGAGLMAAIFVVQLSAGWVDVTGTFETVRPGAAFGLAVLAPVVTFLCVGIYEEALSRGYLLRNIAEGLNLPGLGPRGGILIAWVLSSVVFGALHLANPNATLLSTANITLAGLLLGAGYVATGQLAIPIGVHITWNFFQGTVFGFPVSGLQPIGASFVATEESGPDLLTGGVFGPEAGLLVVAATVIGTLLTFLWVRVRYGHSGLYTPLAEPPKPTEAAETTPNGYR